MNRKNKHTLTHSIQHRERERKKKCEKTILFADLNDSKSSAPHIIFDYYQCLKYLLYLHKRCACIFFIFPFSTFPPKKSESLCSSMKFFVDFQRTNIVRFVCTCAFVCVRQSKERKRVRYGEYMCAQDKRSSLKR